MRVVAIAAGFYEQYRDTADEFEVPEGSKATWFKPVTKQSLAEAKNLKEGVEPAPEKPIALSQIKNTSIV